MTLISGYAFNKSNDKDEEKNKVGRPIGVKEARRRKIEAKAQSCMENTTMEESEQDIANTMKKTQVAMEKMNERKLEIEKLNLPF